MYIYSKQKFSTNKKQLISQIYKFINYNQRKYLNALLFKNKYLWRNRYNCFSFCEIINY